jgi:two-component system, LytTR family, sensor kinase
MDMPRPRTFYIGFLLIFSLFWLLFKIGGTADFQRAMLSFVIDMGPCIGAMMITTDYLLPKYFYHKKYTVFGLVYFLLILVMGSIVIWGQLALSDISLTNYSERVARSNHFFYWFWSDLIFGSYFLVFMITAAGAAIRFAFDRVKAMQNIEQLKKEKLQTELDRLKFQLNPHFLFNALNTINYKIDRSNQPAREILQKFSKMLRYQLYECEKNDIDIEQELWFLRSYIDLQKERMNSNYHISCTGFDTVNGLHIAPFLLLPIVENCFKHVSQYTDRENEIRISCRQEKDIFFFDAANSVAAANGHDAGGIGLKNIRKRLELLYPNAHQLSMKEENGQFALTLQLRLS